MSLCLFVSINICYLAGMVHLTDENGMLVRLKSERMFLFEMAWKAQLILLNNFSSQPYHDVMQQTNNSFKVPCVNEPKSQNSHHIFSSRVLFVSLNILSGGEEEKSRRKKHTRTESQESLTQTTRLKRKKKVNGNMMCLSEFLNVRMIMEN
jgi:hypothetical protein